MSWDQNDVVLWGRQRRHVLRQAEPSKEKTIRRGWVALVLGPIVALATFCGPMLADSPAIVGPNVGVEVDDMKVDIVPWSGDGAEAFSAIAAPTFPCYFSLGVAVAGEELPMPRRGVCAHRGANSTHPENTIPAFLEAIRLGAHQIEFDVYRTRDGKLAVIHDSTVDRTTDGTGRVVDLTLAEIKRLDAGSWKAARFAGTRIPTFREALSVMPRNIWLNLHLKGGGDVGEAVAREVVRQNRTHQAFLACDYDAADAARKVCPKIFICNMHRQGKSIAYAEDTIGRKDRFIQLCGGFPEPEVIGKLKRARVRVNYFGTNDPVELKKLFEAGVEFPLVDQLPEMMEAAKSIGITPLGPIY